jgi:hypothetical protein
MQQRSSLAAALRLKHAVAALLHGQRSMQERSALT